MKVLRIMSSALASLGLVVGFAAFAGATGNYHSYGNNDHGSNGGKKPVATTSQTVEVKNDNKVSLSNKNYQTASSGEAKVVYNTTGGSATTGNTANSNCLSATATISNSMPAAPVMPAPVVSTHHDSSASTAISKVEVNNDNNLTITNDNTQMATTGAASVTNNTTGGSATSGSATNTNNTSVALTVSN